MRWVKLLRLYASLLCRIGETAPVISSGDAHYAMRTFGLIQRQHSVGRTAKFKAAGLL